MPRNTPTAHIINCGFACTAIFQLFSKPKPSKNKDKTHQSEKSLCTKDTTQDGLGELQKYNSQCEGPEEDLGTTELGGCTNSFGDKQAKTDEGGCATTVADKTDLNENKQDPVECFQINFGSVYNLTTSQFQRKDGKSSCFERYVEAVHAAFLAKWHPKEARQVYIDTFSLAEWQKMDQQTQSRHSVSNCIACAVQNSKLQLSMPMRPVFKPENKENLYGPHKQVSEKQFARAHFDKINSLCLASTGKPFAEVAVNHIGPIKRVVNNRMKQCTAECNNALAENAVVRLHVQDISFSKYNKQQLATFFEKPDSTTQPTKGKQVIRVKKLVGLPPPALELLGRIS